MAIAVQIFPLLAVVLTSAACQNPKSQEDSARILEGDTAAHVLPTSDRALVLRARELDRADSLDQARAAYSDAATRLPQLADWLYLRAAGLEAGTVKIREGIQRLANSLRATNKYHETITVFWARAVYQAIGQTPDISDFHEFIERNPHLLDKQLINQYYSADVIGSPLARQQWVEPDLKPLTVNA